MLIKVISAQTYDFQEPVCALVKQASSGLTGVDLRAFEKRAATRLLADSRETTSLLHPGEELVHIYALGTTERYGPNRNGDGFREQVCRDYHDTFVKHARFYRNHLNKDPHQSYGRVIKSAFNATMGRIELLAALYRTKEAADRFKALRADQELEKLASGKDLPTSMACSVSHDICSYCQNHAPRVKDYCKSPHQGGHCKAGGLSDNIGSLVELDGDIHHLHADNPDPDFGDISHVVKGADRISYVTGLLQKTAGNNGVVKSADLAKALGVALPYAVLLRSSASPKVARIAKLAYQLAAIEDDLARGVYPLGLMATAAVSSQLQCTDPFELPVAAQSRFSSLLKAAAAEHVCLPLQRFIELTTATPQEKSAEIAAVVAQDLPGVFSRLVQSGDVFHGDAARYSPATSASTADCIWAKKQAAACSLSAAAVQRRVALASFRDFSPSLRSATTAEKQAGDSPGSNLAREYALYKLAFLAEIPETDVDFGLTTALVVLQNYAN